MLPANSSWAGTQLRLTHVVGPTFFCDFSDNVIFVMLSCMPLFGSLFLKIGILNTRIGKE